MQSLYAKYLVERTNDLIIENEEGFATYRYINENQVYIVDIYVVPEARKKKLASAMADFIANEAKNKGCKEMIGTVVPSAKNSTASIQVLLGYGMSLHSATDNVVVFRKEL